MKYKPKGTYPEMNGFYGNNIRIFALGGLGEVGKNIYCVECNDEIIVIDCGVRFADNEFGVGYLVPNFTYLKNNEHKIKGFFITHGHEDHIGGIPFLLRQVNVKKIYANGIAIALITEKLKEVSNYTVEIEAYESESVFKFNNFELSFFKINHSIPDAHGIAILTSMGYILHTGDFKIDFSPLTYHADYFKLTTYAQKGVLCLLSDSTNALVTKLSPSEKQIGDNINALFRTIKGRIIVATFASNVFRVKQIIDAALENNRKIAAVGRSLDKVIKVSKELNYIEAPESSFVGLSDIALLPDSKIVIIATGSQGEELAALTRMANGVHKQVRIKQGDTIIFSSSAIPGNQDNINHSINLLYKQGAKVIINNSYTDTHTTGHASAYELKMMLALTSPRYFMPIHGEFAMQKRHIEMAVETGVDPNNCYLLENGQVLTFSPTDNRAFLNSEIKADTVYIDKSGLEITDSIRKERKILAEEGTIIITVHLLEDETLQGVDVYGKSFLKMKNYGKLLSNINDIARATARDYFARDIVIASNDFISTVRGKVEGVIRDETGKKPMLITLVMKRGIICS
jgi:ribonuclease J